ncbi:MAG TPA: MBL fold metallo-hydrolase [Solirubrobacteraceae bacterium]|nr:MBL fold metallo-hydrolase [Solirubrobacteraceae bacterium]
MVLEQYYLGCLAHASYLIADPDAGEAAVVDPQRDVQQYVDDARELGCRISHVFLTHFHADFVAGHLELRDREQAQIHLGARASAEFEFEPMADGDSVEVGGVRLEVLETPGHSPESISILVRDAASEVDPYAVLTGDTLFIGDVGRPDLRAALGWGAQELGGMLYESLHGKLMPLPDDTLVYPTHGAGSLCGKNLSSETVSTIGEQRRYNYALQPMSRERFIEIVTADQPDTPAYFSYDAVLNTREHPTLEETLTRELHELSLARVLELAGAGAQLLDVRDPADFAGAHLRGSVNVGLGGSFATWSGTVLDHDSPIVLIAEPGREREAATRLGRIGFDNVAGYLAGGMGALAATPELVERLARVTAEALSEQLDGPSPPRVVDVRSTREWDERHLEQALSMPLSRLAGHIEEVPRDRPLVIHCASDYRAAIAASLIAREGGREVAVLVGGLPACESARLASVAG